MFGFSLQKIMLLVGIIGAVWYGYKLANRLMEKRERDGLEPKRQRAKKGTSWRASRRSAAKADPADGTEDMVQCPVCQSYVAARSTTSCGRSDCPY